jgi:hypothetical protein
VGAAMHELAKKNKYMGFLFMKIRPEYFALGREGIHEVSAAHARELAKHAKQLTHVVTSGVDGRYDQVTIVEADSLEEIHAPPPSSGWAPRRSTSRSPMSWSG